MKIKEIELTEAITGGKDWNIQDMAKYMKEKKVRQVYIVENKSIVGVVGMADIVYKAVSEGKINVEAQKIMNSPVIYADGEMTATEAYYLMLKNNIFSIPVLLEGNFMGELALAKAYEKMQKNPQH